MKSKSKIFIYSNRRSHLNKRGSHVGVVLSFVIFVTFIIFLYSITEPAMRMQRDKESLLDYLKIELIKRFSANLTSVAVMTNKTVKESCVELVNLTEEVEVDSHLIIKDEKGDISLAKISGNDLFIDRVIYESELVFFKIYNSEEFEALDEGAMEGCKELKRDEKGYIIGLVRTDEYIFEKKIIDLINEYETNYDNLKTNELKIPSGSEFGFSLIYSNETRIGTEEKNISTNIYAREIPIQYVDEEANINSGFINIKVW